VKFRITEGTTTFDTYVVEADDKQEAYKLYAASPNDYIERLNVSSETDVVDIQEVKEEEEGESSAG
jgi:hypothetical protein